MRCPRRRGRFALSLCFAVVAALLGAQSAAATFHLVSIREVHPGSAAAPESSYVELQMYSPGQNHVGTHSVNLYNATGTQIGSAFTFPGALTPPAEGVNQETMLVGDSGVQAAFGVTPDLVSSSFNVPAAGGAACWDTIDCVAWGNFSGSVGSAVGTPAAGAGIPDGMAIRRKITGGTCTNLLDGSDDTNNSASDFAAAAPAPVSYSTVPSPPTCTPVSPPPTTIIETKPPIATKLTSASFAFHSSPAGAGFECRVDAEAFADCDSGTASYSGLSVASHTFEAKATDANGTGPAATYTWTIDQTPPTVTVDNPKPANPNSGKGVVLKYHSSEANSTFECSLAKGAAADAFSSCPTTGKALPTITENGSYTFKVLAIDQATNKGAPESFTFTVDTSLAEPPPEVTIMGKPSDPSSSTTATFTYVSTLTGSTFACRLDAGAFTPCDAGGITYIGLAEGPHSFQVKATNMSEVTGNPAGYSFTVVLPQTPPVITPPPPPGPTPSAPDTTITSKPKAKTADRTPTFKFKSSLAGASYECTLDGKALKPCRSPLTTKSLSFGRHTLKVAAIAAGIKDPSPASSSFKVVKPR